MYGSRDRRPLFSTHDGFSVQRGQVENAAKEVEQFSEERILNTDPDELTQYLVDKFHVEVPTLDLASVTATEHEREVEVYNYWDQATARVPGMAFDFEIPFSGEADVFQVRPNSYDTNPPYGEVRGQILKFSVSGRELTGDQVTSEFEGMRDAVQKYLGWHKSFWAGHDEQIRQAVRDRINARRERLLKQKSAGAGLSRLGITLKTKADDARTFVPPAVKKTIEPKLPPMRPAAPLDPTLDLKQYEDILGLVRGAGRSIEQSSSRTRTLEEEALRDMLLVPLNAHFGAATGEAFNFNGKTDMLIRHQGGNLFVAECKIWGGDKHFLAAIDQLLSYLTWRDTKAALIVFNRNVGFSGVVEKARQLPLQHPNFINGPVRLDETSSRFTFSLPQDFARHVTLSVLAFDLGPN